MNKLVYGIIALVVIAAVGVGAYFVVGQKPSDSTEVTSELPTEEPTEAPGVSRESASFSDMISKGQNQMCTFSDSETESVGVQRSAHHRARDYWPAADQGHPARDSFPLEAAIGVHPAPSRR